MKRRDFVVSGIGAGIGFGLATPGALSQTAQPAPPARGGRGASGPQAVRMGPAPAGDPIQSASRASGPVADPWPNTKRLLFVADVQTGYHHDAINHTMGVVEELGRTSLAVASLLNYSEGEGVSPYRLDSGLYLRRCG